MTATTPDLRYPVGRFTRPTSLSPAERARAIAAIAKTPTALRAAVSGLNDAQLDTPYRPGGWSVRQSWHHVPDSHMNAYTRFKLALRRTCPPSAVRRGEVGGGSRTQREAREHSLTLLDALHARWVFLLERMKPSDFERQLNHPEWDAPMPLDSLLALYAWHGKHHTAHITALRERKGW